MRPKFREYLPNVLAVRVENAAKFSKYRKMYSPVDAWSDIFRAR